MRAAVIACLLLACGDTARQEPSGAAPCTRTNECPVGQACLEGFCATRPAGMRLMVPERALYGVCTPVRLDYELGGLGDGEGTLVVSGDASLYRSDKCADPSDAAFRLMDCTHYSDCFQSVVAYVRARGSFVVQATGAGEPVSAAVGVDVTPAPPSRLGLSAPRLVAIGACVPVTLTLFEPDRIAYDSSFGLLIGAHHDLYASPARSPLPLAISASTATDFDGPWTQAPESLFADVACTTSLASPVEVPIGAAGIRLFARAGGEGQLAIEADGLDEHSVIIESRTATSSTQASLGIAGPPSARVSECSAFYVSLQSDAPVLAPSDTDFTLTTSGTGTFFADPSCTAASAFVTVPGGESGGTFYYRASEAESVSLTATGSTDTATISLLHATP